MRCHLRSGSHGQPKVHVWKRCYFPQLPPHEFCNERLCDPTARHQGLFSDYLDGSAGSSQAWASFRVNSAIATDISPHKISGVLAFGLLWAGIGIVLALVYAPDGWLAVLGALMVTQAFCGVLTYRRFRATRDAVLPDFLSTFLFLELVNKTVTAIGVVANNAEGGAQFIEQDSYYGITYVATRYQFQAALVLLAAIVIFSLVWMKLERGRILALWTDTVAAMLPATPRH